MLASFSGVFSFVTEPCALWAGTTRLEREMTSERVFVDDRFRGTFASSLTRCDGCLTLSERQGIPPIALIFKDGLEDFFDFIPECRGQRTRRKSDSDS